MPRLIIGSRDFENRKLREARELGEDVVLHRALETQIRAAADDARALDFIISTGSVDRYGDTIAPEGWKLEAYRKNPVVLWMHDNTLLPVARAVNVRVEEGKLKARAEFTPAGLARFNDTVFEMLKTGFLSATSVGFVPLKYNFVDDPSRRFGMDFLEQELLEFSLVSVPANSEASIEGRGLAELVEQGRSLDIARRRQSLLSRHAA